MNTYTFTTRSTLYTTYEIEAENEAEAERLWDSARYEDDLCETHSWTEDTEVMWVEEEGEEQ